MRMGRSLLRGLGAATVGALALLVAFAAFAQSRTTGEIFGVVTDESGAPVAGASIIAIGPQGARTATTNDDGEYRIEFLPTGDYSVTASAEGQQSVTVQGVSVRLDNRSRADVELQPMAEVAETITVTAEAPTVDTAKTSTSTEITSDMLGKVPTGRSVGSVLDLAAGVTDGGATGAGNPSISGASGLENTYIVDGVNITNTGYGSIGSYSIRYGSLGTGVNFDFVDTVQVKSGGFEAEYGQALGGIVNVITKRGSNELKGSVFGYYRPHWLESDRREVSLQDGNTNITRTEGWDVGFEVGGPVVKDKLFFFVAADPQQDRIGRKVNDQDPNGDGTIDFPLGGEYVTVQNRQAYAGKLSWNIMPNHRLELSVFGDPGRSQQGPQSGSDLLAQQATRFSELQYGGNNQVLRYEGIATDWLTVEAQISRATNTFSQGFPAKNDQRSVFDTTVSPSLRSGGVGFYEQEQTSENTQYHLKFTNYFQGAGAHELKYGLAYEDVTFTNRKDYTGAPLTVIDPDTGEERTTTTGVTITRLFADDGTTVVDRATRGDFSPPAKTTTDYFSVFLQDKWNPIQTVTVSAGLRLEEQRLNGTAQSYVFKMSDNVAPRVGAAWDFTGRGRGKVYGHYGRFYEKIPNDIAVRLFSPEEGISQIDFIDANGDGELTPDEQIPNGDVPINGSTEHYLVVGGGKQAVAPGTKSQFQDEWVLGAEYEAIPKWNVGLRWIHRELGRVLEDYTTTTVEGFLDGSEEFSGYTVGNPDSSLPCPPAFPNCWRDPIRQYDAMELTVEKRFSDNWQMLGSYRLSRLYGNYEGLFRNDNGQSDPNITSLFDFPNNTPAMEGQGKPGLLNTDRTHIVQIAGSYSAPTGFGLGAVARFQSGTPITKLNNHPLYQNQGEVPVEGGRGAQGRNPDTFTVDLHADYQFDLPRGLEGLAIIDVLNVLDSQEPTSVNEFAELSPGVPNPDYLAVTSYQRPRQVRLGFKVLF